MIFNCFPSYSPVTNKMFHNCLYLLFVLFCTLNFTKGQYLNNTGVWCTVSKSEQEKCLAFSRAVDNKIAAFRNDYLSLNCTQAFDKEECMNRLDAGQVHLTTVDAGEVFVGGRYHSLIPIMQEIYENGLDYQYAVAVVKKGSLPDVQSIYNLRGKRACFGGVGSLAGWVLPIYTLMRSGGLEVIDCNNHVKSAIKFFGPSCAVNSLIDKYNPLGDNSNHLCSLCNGTVSEGKCTNADPYAGYEGAFKCLRNSGDIAFLVHTTIFQLTSQYSPENSIRKENFELLCRDGSRRPVDDFLQCNWGRVPSNAVMTSSAVPVERRIKFQRFLTKAAELLRVANFTNYESNNRFGPDGNPNYTPNYDTSRTDYNTPVKYDRGWNTSQFGTFDNFGNNFENNSREHEDGYIDSIHNIETFDLFESHARYNGQYNLIFSDATRSFRSIPEPKQRYSEYLGRSMDAIMGVRHCPVSRMRMCVSSDPEMDKCVKMRTALNAQLLKPELECHKGYSRINCMQAVKNGDADVVVLDAGDIYTAGLHYQLIPFISEVYNLHTSEYYVVAVAKEEDNSTDITYLKNKNTCHAGMNTGAGWIYPMAYLISNSWIRGYGCDAVQAAAEYFTKSCVPGAISPEYNTGVPYENLCGLCHGPGKGYCQRDATEDYYGYTGAFRCLVEGGGDVAFVKHTTVFENTDGKRKEFWARNTFMKDYQLLCPDGKRKTVDKYASCNLGKIAANAIVTRGDYYGYNETQINAYINLFISAQQFYGRKDPDDFTFALFYSTPPYTDLIFQDAAQQLVVVPKEKREFSAYLGPDFMKAKRITDCTAGASKPLATFFLAGFIFFLAGPVLGFRF